MTARPRALGRDRTPEGVWSRPVAARRRRHRSPRAATVCRNTRANHRGCLRTASRSSASSEQSPMPPSFRSKLRDSSHRPVGCTRGCGCPVGRMLPSGSKWSVDGSLGLAVLALGLGLCPGTRAETLVLRRWPSPCPLAQAEAFACGREPSPCPLARAETLACKRGPKPLSVTWTFPEGRVRWPRGCDPAALAGFGWLAVGFRSPASWIASTFHVAVSRSLPTHRSVTPKRHFQAVHF